MITSLLRFIFLIIVFFFVKKLLFSVFSIGKSSRPKVPRDSERNNPLVKRDQVEKDPVCGMFVAREAAVMLKTSEGDRYFCSEECRDKFLEQSKP